jgi:hypothetical protein
MLTLFGASLILSAAFVAAAIYINSRGASRRKEK